MAVAVAVAVAQIPCTKVSNQSRLKYDLTATSYEKGMHTYLHMYMLCPIYIHIYIYIHMWHLWHVACEWRHSFCLAARFHFGISILFPYLTRAPSLHIFCRKPSIVACIAFLSKPARDSAPAGGRVGCMCGG